MRQQSNTIVLTWRQKLALISELAFAAFCLLKMWWSSLVASHEVTGYSRVAKTGSFCLLLFCALQLQAAESGTLIQNTASLNYRFSGENITINSNTVTDTTVPKVTTAGIRLLSYVPGSVPQTFSATEYQNGGSFSAVAPAVPFGTTTALDPTVPQPLAEETRFHIGDPLFIEVTDNDQNLDAAVIDTVLITVTSDSGDEEVLRLQETGPNTGVFVGYLPSNVDASGSSEDGTLQVQPNTGFNISYDDGAAQPLELEAAMDPEGIVFDSRSGTVVNGATVSLIDAATGELATVYGDDGVSSFPNPLVSGSTVTDGAGVEYQFSTGAYRFPVIIPGTYRLHVAPPQGFIFPSKSQNTDLGNLQARSLYLEEGIRGENFIVGGDQVVPLKAKDIPLDAVAVDLFMTKNANRTQVGIGDFVQYVVAMDNSSSSLPTDTITITDVLPKGFRYQENSTFHNDEKLVEPEISEDGRTLQWRLTGLDAGSVEKLRYVVQVIAGAGLGKSINRVSAVSDSGLTSNVAEAPVYVRDELFMNRGFLLGRVIVGSCDADNSNDREGLKGARVLLENGAYVITDAEGKWHIEGVSAGTHVVQLDLESLPEEYEIIECEKNSRFAGSAFSQFVDLQPGAIWRADFYVQKRPPMKSEIKQQLTTWFSGEKQAEVALNVSAGDVPVKKMRSMINLPVGWKYVDGTATLDGEPVADLQQAGNTLIFNLGSHKRGWQRDLHLQMQQVDEADASTEVRATGLYTTATKPGGRLPVISNTVTAADKPKETTESTTSIQAEEVESVSDKTEQIALQDVEYVKFDDVWLNSAKPGTELLYPSESFNPAIPSIRIGVKHNPKHKVELKLNGEPVNPLNFFGAAKNPQGTVAISRWQGVDLQDGDNRLEMVVYNEKGLEIKYTRRNVHYSGAPVYAEIVEEMSYLVADGKTSPVVAVWFMDQAGFPARYGVIGDYELNSPYKAQNVVEDQKAGKLLNFSAASRPRFQIENDGIAYIRLQPTTQAGEVVLNFPLSNRDRELRTWIKPAKREWVFVGFAEGVIGKHMAFKGERSARIENGIGKGTYTDGRAAFYAKGQIRGDWLLTAAYDTGKEMGDKLGQEIDPNQYYTLYGDDTVQQYDAESSRKLYLKLEKEKFYALFGDFDTGLTVTELGRYNRSLTGIKTEYRGEKWQVNAFAAPTKQSFIRDEIRGDGTSGLYRLSRADLLENSEKITIQVRDRLRSEVIISEESQTRHVDYNIDYEAGTIWFRRPIASTDADRNPTFIVIEYETEDQKDEKITAGARAAYQLEEGKQLGATVIREGNKGQSGQLLALDAQLQLNKQFKLEAEVAGSSKDVNNVKESGSAFAAELVHTNKQSDTKVYLRNIDAEYGLGQQNMSEVGMRKVGVENTWKLDKVFDTESELYRQQNLESDSSRDVAEARLNYRQEGYSLYAGGRHAKDSMVGKDDFSSTQLLLGGNWQFFDSRLTLRSDIEWQLAEAEQENQDFANRVLFGADYAITRNVDIFAVQEFSFAETQDTRSSLLGLRARPWTGAEMSSSVEREAVADSARLVSNLGFSQNWHWSKGWSASLLFDRSYTIENETTAQQPINSAQAPLLGSNSDDFYAISTGLGYNQQVYEWSSRLEYRNSEKEEKWNVGSGYYRTLSEGVAMASGITYQRTENEENGERERSVDLQTSFAWRPVDSRFIILERFDLIFDKKQGLESSSKAEKFVQNLHASYKYNFDYQLALQYSSKYVFDTIDDQSYKGYTDLTDLELRYNLSEHWDLGAHIGALHSWQAGTLDKTYGLSVGFSPSHNIWVNLGFNYQGFSDEDFSTANYTSKGVYLQFRMKFDQQSLKDVLKSF